MVIVEIINDRTRKCSVGGCSCKLYPGKRVYVELNDNNKPKAYMCSDRCRHIWESIPKDGEVVVTVA